MGLPTNIEVNGRYVITTERAGANSKLIVERLADGQKDQLIMKEEWWRMLNGLCTTSHDLDVLEMLCDELFA